MLPENHKTIFQKKYFILSTCLGLLLLFLSFVPDMLGLGKKGLGYVELFFIRNGVIFIIAGLTLLLIPGLANYLKRTFNDNEYLSELRRDLTDRGPFSKYDLTLLLLFLVGANFFAVHIVGKQHYIFNWDSAIFSEKYAIISTIFKSNPVHALYMVLLSIQYDHYNLFSTFLLMPFSLLMGVGRLSFILSMVNIFLLISAAAFVLLFKRIASIMYNGRLPLGITFFVLFTFFIFPFVWIPLLDGYVGVGGFSIIGLILFLYSKYPLPAQRYRTLALLGVLLPTLVIFRQYYIFWVASFFIALIINEYVFMLVEYRLDRKRFFALSKKIFFTMFVSGIFFLMIAGPFLMDIFTGDYSYMTIYKFHDSALQDLGRFLNNFGLLYIAMTLSGLFISFYYSNTRKLASFLLIQWVVTFLLFTRIHSFLPNFYDLLIPTMILLMALFITGVFVNIKSGKARTAVCLIFILILSLNFSVVFFPGVSQYTHKAKALLPGYRYEPPVRNDIPEIKRMLDIISGLLRGTSDGIYVLASNELLNSDVLEKAYLSLPYMPNMGNHIYRSGALDLKDGFPNSLFKAKYVLVADPIQHEFSSQQARTVVIPAASILKGENMGASYRRLPYEFNFDAEKKKAKVYLYERVGPVNQSDVDFLSNELRKYYPDKPFVYQPNMSDDYSTGR